MKAKARHSDSDSDLNSSNGSNQVVESKGAQEKTTTVAQ